MLDLFLCEVEENYPRVNLLALDEGRKIHASKPLVVLRFYPPNSLANSGEDTIMVETSPSCKCKRGLYSMAKFLRHDGVESQAAGANFRLLVTSMGLEGDLKLCYWFWISFLVSAL